MLDLIASDLWYVSLIRLMDVETHSPYWGATASLTRERALTIMGPTPDATLTLLVMRTLSSRSFMSTAPAAILDHIADRMLRLLLIRPRSSGTGSPHLWTVTVWMRGHVEISATGQMPDEALCNLVDKISAQRLH